LLIGAGLLVVTILGFFIFKPSPPKVETAVSSTPERQFAEARAMEKAASGFPDKYPTVRATWKALVDEYRGTPQHDRFAGALVEFDGRMADEAERAADRVLEAMSPKLATGRHAEALLLLRGYPEGFASTPAARRITDRSGEI